MKTSKKIKQLLKGKQYTKYCLFPGDVINMTNDTSKLITIYAGRNEFSFLGKIFDFIGNKLK